MFCDVALFLCSIYGVVLLVDLAPALSVRLLGAEKLLELNSGHKAKNIIWRMLLLGLVCCDRKVLLVIFYHYGY